MEPPPPSAATPPHLTYPDSLNSSPRSRNSWDESMYPSASSAKLRLMCSYGGHIIPRPHDKSLCYVGGDTRIVVIDRHTTLSDLTHRLSKILLHTQSFILKYQLPNEELDSLISVTTDEDLENMMDEYDRLSSSNKNKNKESKSSSRLRLFLFSSKPDSGSSIGSLVENSTKSEDWFLNALNGATSGFSDSSSVNCLLGLDDDTLIAANLNSDVEALGNMKGVTLDIHLMPDYHMVETTSSSGSASSSAIRFHGEDQKVGIEEQFAQMSTVVANDQQKQNGGDFVGLATMVSAVPVQAPLQQHTQSVQQTQTCGFDSSSPDSVSSDGSITNPLSRQKPMIYQEPVVQIQPARSRSPASPVKPNIMEQLQDYGYLLPAQFDPQHHPQLHHQQQFIHAGTQYIPNHPSGTLPAASYYPIYPSKQHHNHHSALDQQYHPVYYVPARQSQPYNSPVQQPSYSESAPEIASGGMYRTATTGVPSLVQVPSSQQQPQYVGFNQLQHQSHSLVPNSTANANYAYEFAEPTQARMYYTQALAPQFAAHLPIDNIKQQVRTSQQ